MQMAYLRGIFRVHSILLLLALMAFVITASGLSLPQDTMEKLKKLYAIEGNQFRTPAGAIPLESVRVYPPGGDDPKGPFIGAAQDFCENESGSVFIPDRQGSEILVFDLKGDLQLRFGRVGQGPGEFIRPTGVFAWDDRVLTHEVEALRFQLFDSKGRFFSSFISSKPYGDYLVAGNKIYASPNFGHSMESGGGLIDILDFKGKILSSFGAVPEMPKWDTSKASVYLASADDSELFVAFRYLPMIRVYSFDGKLLNEFALKTPIVEKIAPLNEKMFARRDQGEQTPLGFIVNAVYADKDGLFILTAANRRLEIILVDPKGKILEYYYRNLSSPFSCRGLFVRKRAGKKEFHILRTYPEVGVEVFAAK